MRPVGCCSRHLGFLTVALMLALIVACGGNSPASGNQEGMQARGKVLEVVARSIVELESLRIRDETGKEWMG